MVNPNDWLVGAGCNLFHADDVAMALLELRVPFSVDWVRKVERAHECILAMRAPTSTSHYVHVQASGYGMGEALHFSRYCPPRLLFRVCRALALQHTRKMMKYYEYSLSRQKTNATSRHIRDNERRALANLQRFDKEVKTRVRTYADLVRVATAINRREAREWKKRTKARTQTRTP